ncbi:methylosome subunit pICln-like [Rhopalosiphum maidis]|uniref:methylosome subunit pICln-like n=1 Tax=Rhopalosiphum maidis TaxID=43146 RepID=UPI000EFF918C|nr:methylosome subunit pICln-like [Rhopalosiphum maidis]
MDTLASFNEEDESIQRCESNITLIVDEVTFGKGTLYVAESKLYWKNGATNQVVSIDYKSMCVFGTCNHPVVHEKPCLQIIVDFAYKPSDSIQPENGQILNGDNHSNEDDNSEEDNEDEEEEEMKSKIKLVPDSPECLNEIYEAFTRVQPLHNSNDADSEEEAEEEDFYYNENDEFEDYDEDDAEQILRN